MFFTLSSVKLNACSVECIGRKLLQSYLPEGNSLLPNSELAIASSHSSDSISTKPYPAALAQTAQLKSLALAMLSFHLAVEGLFRLSRWLRYCHPNYKLA